MSFVVAVLLVALGLWALGRSRALFVVSVRDGRVQVVRGRVPTGVLQEFEDVVRRPPVRRATIKALAGRDGPRLSISGVDEGTAQRLRNVFHLFPLARVRR